MEIFGRKVLVDYDPVGMSVYVSLGNAIVRIKQSELVIGGSFEAVSSSSLKKMKAANKLAGPSGNIVYCNPVGTVGYVDYNNPTYIDATNCVEKKKANTGNPKPERLDMCSKLLYDR